jgi:hypothetical protein
MAPPDRLPEWILERFACGDLPEHLRADVQRRLDADPAAARQLEELRASDGEIRARLPPFSQIEERARRAGGTERSGGWRWSLIIPVFAAAAVAVVSLRPANIDTPAGAEAESTRIKGSDRLTIYRQTGRGAEPLRDGADARAREILQIGYAASANRYGVIVSVDGRGTVTLHHPDSPAGSTQLGASGALPSGYQLDDAPGFERFILVTSSVPVPIERVLQAARALASAPGHGREGPLDLPSEFAQSSLVVRKVQP